MDIKVILMCLSVLLVSNTSFAFDVIHPTTIFEHRNLKDTIVKQTSYTDFSGTWKAKCVFANYEQEDTVIIKNTADYIEFGNKRYFIGDSLSTESIVRPQSTYFDHKQIEWSEDGKSLKGRNVKVVGTNHGKSLYTYLFTDDMSLVNDQITIEITIKTFKEMTLVEESKGNCVLQRA